MVSVDPKVLVMRRAAKEGIERRGQTEERTENDRSVDYQHFDAGVRLSLAAILTRSAREAACIFCITLPR